MIKFNRDKYLNYVITVHNKFLKIYKFNVKILLIARELLLIRKRKVYFENVYMFFFLVKSHRPIEFLTIS